jgi:hypothetical protein
MKKHKILFCFLKKLSANIFLLDPKLHLIKNFSRTRLIVLISVLAVRLYAWAHDEDCYGRYADRTFSSDSNEAEKIYATNIEPTAK